EEGRVAQAEIAGKAAQQRPAGRQRDPEEHEVDEGIVERRQACRRQQREAHDGKAGHGFGQVAGGVHSHSGSHSRITISIENDTTGAQAGLRIAMAMESLAPTSMPAASAPSGLPRRPMMTTANTTPSHVQICAGARVAMSAMK